MHGLETSPSQQEAVLAVRRHLGHELPALSPRLQQWQWQEEWLRALRRSVWSQERNGGGERQREGRGGGREQEEERGKEEGLHRAPSEQVGLEFAAGVAQHKQVNATQDHCWGAQCLLL